MGMLDDLGSVQVRSRADRVKFEVPATYQVQTTKVEGPLLTRKKMEFYRLSFQVLAVEEDPEGQALAPGSEPELALFDDEWKRGTKVLLAFIMASKGLTETLTNSLTEEDIVEMIAEGSLEGIVLRLEIVPKEWKDNDTGREATFYNPTFRGKIDKRKLSKEAKGFMI